RPNGPASTGLNRGLAGAVACAGQAEMVILGKAAGRMCPIAHGFARAGGRKKGERGTGVPHRGRLGVLSIPRATGAVSLGSALARRLIRCTLGNPPTRLAARDNARQADLPTLAEVGLSFATRCLRWLVLCAVMVLWAGPARALDPALDVS